MQSIILGLYGFILTISWPFLYLYYLLRIRTDGKYGLNHRQRLGLERPPLLSNTRRIWIHALSVGETLSVIPLVKALQENDSTAEIIFSTATESGQGMARQRLSQWVKHFFYLPHDFSWSMRAYVQNLRPSLFILVETDIWPNLLTILRHHQVPTVLVNGRLSPGSFERLLRFRLFVKPLLRHFDFIFPQSIRDRDQYRSLGMPEDRIQTIGNLKFDLVSPRISRSERMRMRGEIGVENGQRVWIAGSTHEGEEEILLETHQRLRQIHHDLLLILVPRHIQRAPKITSVCHQYGFFVAARSTLDSVRGKEVFLLDTLGELGRFYAIGDVAFIGGSLIPFGGHNPLEAVAQGIPALWGPHLFNFREMEEQLLKTGCARRVSSKEELQDTLNRWLTSPQIRDQIKEASESFFKTHSGCSQKIAQRLIEVMGDGK
jgi:3-deoxy-D-manno-octulosonic-acid transferase